MDKETRKEVEEMISNQAEKCGLKNDLILQGQAATVSSVKELTRKTEKLITLIDGNGSVGLKTETALNTAHRKKMDTLMNRLTYKVISMIIVGVLGGGGIVFMALKMAGKI